VSGANGWHLTSALEISKSVMTVTARSHGPAYGHRTLGQRERVMTNTNIDRELAEVELGDDELAIVSGGTYTKQKADGSSAGNVAAKWSVAQGHAA
jgi:hypothetical protein